MTAHTGSSDFGCIGSDIHCSTAVIVKDRVGRVSGSMTYRSSQAMDKAFDRVPNLLTSR